MDGKEVWKLKKRGEITVFLSLCLLSVAALICVMVEGARSAGSRVYLQIGGKWIFRYIVLASIIGNCGKIPIVWSGISENVRRGKTA